MTEVPDPIIYCCVSNFEQLNPSWKRIHVSQSQDCISIKCNLNYWSFGIWCQLFIVQVQMESARQHLNPCASLGPEYASCYVPAIPASELEIVYGKTAWERGYCNWVIESLTMASSILRRPLDLFIVSVFFVFLFIALTIGKIWGGFVIGCITCKPSYYTTVNFERCRPAPSAGTLSLLQLITIAQHTSFYF